MDDSADAFGGTVGRVEIRGPLPEGFQVSPQVLEIPEPLVHLDEPFVNERRDVTAGCFAAVSDFKDLAELAEGEPDCLSGADELETFHHGRVVVPVAGLGPLRCGDETFLLVEAYRRGGEACLVGDFTDLHLVTLPLDLQPYLKL